MVTNYAHPEIFIPRLPWHVLVLHGNLSYISITAYHCPIQVPSYGMLSFASSSVNLTGHIQGTLIFTVSAYAEELGETG